MLLKHNKYISSSLPLWQRKCHLYHAAFEKNKETGFELSFRSKVGSLNHQTPFRFRIGSWSDENSAARFEKRRKVLFGLIATSSCLSPDKQVPLSPKSDLLRQHGPLGGCQDTARHVFLHLIAYPRQGLWSSG